MSNERSRQRANRLRIICLKAVLLASGAQRDLHDKAKWHTDCGMISVTGSKFFNWNQGSGGGGAIDLAMHLTGRGFNDALDWLEHRFPGTVPPVPAASPSRRPLALPAAITHKLPAVKHYLARQRHLPMGILSPLVDDGRIYADHRANAVFLLRDKHNTAVGAELRGTGPYPWRGMAPGSQKDSGYFAVGPPQPQCIILCESAIDAISCLALNPGQCCISTSGSSPNPRWLSGLIDRGLPIYCGFDTDPTGDAMAKTIIARHPAVQRLRPPCHDWNDALRAIP